MQVVIIGGGVAGTTAAGELRKLDPEAQITILEEENYQLYSRVLLPHMVKGKVPRERVFLKKPEWYQEQNIELMLGVTATKIDTKNHFVETSEGRELPYDKLLITTGGEINLLPDDCRGVSYFRTLDDADNFLKLVQEMKASGGGRGLVYGGGFISLEFINAFAHFDIPTTVLMRSPGFWSSALSEHSQKALADHATGHNVELVSGVDTLELVQEKAQLTGVRTSAGDEYAGSILGVGIGIERKMKLLTNAGIEIDRGVVANEYLETSAEGVYTAGDIAQFFDVTADRQILAGNWMNAMTQGRVVGKTMGGERTKFELVSSYATNLLGLEVTFIGDCSRSSADEVVQHVAQDDQSIELFQRDGRTVGAVMIGSASERQAITNAIKSRELYT